MSLRSLSIRGVLVAAFTALLMVILVLGGVGLRGIASVNDRVVEVNTNWLPSVRTIQAVSIYGSRYATNVYRHVLMTDAAEIEKLEKAIDSIKTKTVGLMAAYEPLISSPRERTLYGQVVQTWKEYIDVTDQVLALSRQHDEQRARALMMDRGQKIRIAFVDLVDQLVALNVDGALQSQTESDASYASTKLITIAAVIFGAALAIGLGILIIRIVGNGIASVVRPMTALAGGDLSVAIPHRGARTEIGTIADAVAIFQDRLLQMKRLEDETVAARAGAEAQRRQGMRQMADDFEAAVGSIIGTVGAAATELEATARAMTTTASTTAAQSLTVASAAEEAATNVNTVSAAAEELGSSVAEIGRQVQGSASLAENAVHEAEATAALVQELSSATVLIGNVVDLISNIASQTNLLALNATIEAARAGEAGRGFAVVATEVKELAGQTARATSEIGTQISRIQGATENSVKAIGGIRGRISEISSVAASIAAAVEQQGAATQEIVRNVSQAAAGTGEVTSNITGVATAAEETGAAATQVLSSASELSRQSEHLRDEVNRFLTTIRAA